MTGSSFAATFPSSAPRMTRTSTRPESRRAIGELRSAVGRTPTLPAVHQPNRRLVHQLRDGASRPVFLLEGAQALVRARVPGTRPLAVAHFADRVRQAQLRHREFATLRR